MELIDVMCDWDAVNIIQRPAIDKQHVEMVNKYASTENVRFFLDNTLIRRKSAEFRTSATKLLGISERALLEQYKRHGINKKGQIDY
ncbi:MAG: hypothetical protein HDS24_05580 [Bacteroides sp.]|nr:hypothetical protein [Bacteroides sp.]